MRLLSRTILSAIVMLLLIGSLHCGAGRQRVTVRIPPRVDLTTLERIGVVEFRSPDRDDLGRLATQRFADSARRDQGLVRMLDLGPEGTVLGTVGYAQWEPAAYQALGSRHDVRTILIGELTLSPVRPSVSVAPDLASGSLSMQVRATLTVRLVEAESGASLWSRTASATSSVGNLDVFSGEDVRIAAGDPEAAYGALVNNLVGQVTDDFHVHWERR